MAAQTLQDLYKLEPTARAAIYKSAGYAVFNNMGTNLLLLNTARGAGIAVNVQTKQETFMKMISGAGLGIGVKDYRVLFVFENDKALAIPRLRLIRFSQADAAAKAGEKGGAYSGAVELLSAHLLYGLPPDALHWGARFKSTLIENFNRFMTLNGHRTCLPLESNNISLDPEVKDAWGLPALRVTYIFSEHSWNCSTPLAQERSGPRR